MSPTASPYFRVERSPAKQAGPQWRAAATLVRADTEEPVAHLSARAPTAEAAERQLDAVIENKLAGLEKPPDWGRDPTVFRLLKRYLQLRDTLYGMSEQANAAAESDAPRLRRDAAAYEERELKSLQEQVEALTEAQLEELATPTQEQLAQIESPWVLDVLTAKKQLCQYIAHRSPAVQAGYEQLERALNG